LEVAGPGICRLALRIKFSEMAKRHRWVDNGDTFATHRVGGSVGTVATGLFARRDVAAYDGITEILGECVFDGNWGQLRVQVLERLLALFGVLWRVMFSLECLIVFRGWKCWQLIGM
jgi:ammonia channel protein AmtB